MPRPPYTEAQRAAMRNRILDAAWALLKEHGPSGLSTRGIASVVGVSAMALYTYFPNRGAILQALAARETATMRARQRALETRVAEGGDPVVAIRDSMQVLIDLEHNEPDLFHLAWVMPEAAPDGGGLDRARRRQQEMVLHMAILVRAGLERGVFHVRDEMIASAAVLGMVLFPMVLFHNGRIPEAAMRDRLVAEMVDAAIGYLVHGGEAGADSLSIGVQGGASH